MQRAEYNMNFIIEKAQTRDIDGVEQLYNDICDFLAAKEYNPGWRKGYYPTRREVLYFLEKDALYVVKSQGKIVGSVALTHSSNAEAEESLQYLEMEQKDVFFIHDFVVHPDCHHQGIGTAMLAFAEELGRQQGVKSIRLYVYEKNTVAISVYEKSGYVYREKVDIGLSQFGLDWFCLYEKVLNNETI